MANYFGTDFNGCINLPTAYITNYVYWMISPTTKNGIKIQLK